MATAGSVQAKIVGLITKANETTGNTDADLTTAVDALVKGYGTGGGGGEQPTLFAPVLTVKDTIKLKKASFTMAANEQNGGFAVNLSLKVNGEIVENPHTATEVGTYTVEAIANAENFADGVNTQIVEVTEQPLSSEGLEFSTTTVNGKTGFAVSLGTCTDIDVIVPSVYDGTSEGLGYGEVLSVKKMVSSNIETVRLPETIEYISYQAFYGATSLVSVNIPDSVSYIGSDAFRNCPKLSSITIPNIVTKIYSRTFQGCAALEYIAIPKNVTSIGDYAFYNCSELKCIDFSNHESVPSLEATTSIYPYHADLQIRVPSALYDEWRVATNWTVLAGHGKIVPV